MCNVGNHRVRITIGKKSFDHLKERGTRISERGSMNTHSWDNDDCQCVQYYGDRRIISFLEDFWREEHNWPGRLSNIHGDEVLPVVIHVGLMRRVWSRLRLLNLFKVNLWLWLLVETLFSDNRGKLWSSNFENWYAHFRIHLSFAEPEARRISLCSCSTVQW